MITPEPGSTAKDAAYRRCLHLSQRSFPGGTPILVAHTFVTCPGPLTPRPAPATWLGPGYRQLMVARDDELELKRRLDEVFDGRSWALVGWVKDNLGRDVAHELPGLVSPFNHLCHDAAAVIERRGMTQNALDLLTSGKRAGWRVEARAASRYVVPVLVAVVLALVFGYPVALVVGVALGVFLVPEVSRWWSRRGDPGLRVSAVKPLGITGGLLGAGAIIGAVVQHDPASIKRGVSQRPEATPENTSGLVSRTRPNGADSNRETPATSSVSASPRLPECITVAMHDRGIDSRSEPEVDVVMAEADQSAPPISGLDLRPYVGRTIRLVVCCPTCSHDVVPAPGLTRVSPGQHWDFANQVIPEVDQKRWAVLSDGTLQATTVLVAVTSESADMRPFAYQVAHGGEKFNEAHRLTSVSGAQFYFAAALEGTSMGSTTSAGRSDQTGEDPKRTDVYGLSLPLARPSADHDVEKRLPQPMFVATEGSTPLSLVPRRAGVRSHMSTFNVKGVDITTEDFVAAVFDCDNYPLSAVFAGIRALDECRTLERRADGSTVIYQRTGGTILLSPRQCVVRLKPISFTDTRAEIQWDLVQHAEDAEHRFTGPFATVLNAHASEAVYTPYNTGGWIYDKSAGTVSYWTAIDPGGMQPDYMQTDAANQAFPMELLRARWGIGQ